MKKVIGIYIYKLNNNEPFWDECSENLGGSETWAIEISKEFQKKGGIIRLFRGNGGLKTSTTPVFIPIRRHSTFG